CWCACAPCGASTVGTRHAACGTSCAGPTGHSGRVGKELPENRFISQVSHPIESLRRTRKKGGVVVPHPPKWYQHLAAFLVWGVIKALAATLRYRGVDESGLFEGAPPGPVILCVWHNRLALSLIGYQFYGQERNPTPGIAAMVSASRDGGFLTAILTRFSVEPVRVSYR